MVFANYQSEIVWTIYLERISNDLTLLEKEIKINYNCNRSYSILPNTLLTIENNFFNFHSHMRTSIYLFPCTKFTQLAFSHQELHPKS